MSRQFTGRFYDDFPVTAALLLVIVGFFALEVVLDSKLQDPAAGGGLNLMSAGGLSIGVLGGTSATSVVVQHEYWRLLASCFLHFGLIHLLFNGWVLVDLGRVCEPMLGRERFLTTFMLCGLGGSAASVGWRWYTQGGAVAAGASGALAGFIGLLLAFSIRHRDEHLRGQMLRWIVWIAIMSVLLGGLVDHAGHIGGLATGLLLGLFVPRYTSSTQAKRWRIPFVVSILVIVVSLGFSIWSLFETLIEIQ